MSILCTAFEMHALADTCRNFKISLLLLSSLAFFLSFLFPYPFFFACLAVQFLSPCPSIFLPLSFLPLKILLVILLLLFGMVWDSTLLSFYVKLLKLHYVKIKQV